MPIIMKKNSFIMPVAALIFVVLFSSCRTGNPSAAEAEQAEVLPEDIVEMRADQIQMAQIELGSIGLHPVSTWLKANGSVEVAPDQRATVCIPMGGFVRSTSILPGNAVKKGQVLAVLENPEFVDLQQSYLEARNRMVFAEGEFKRHSALYKEDVYSEMNLQQVTVNYNNLKTEIRSIGQKLRMIGIDPDGLSDGNISSTVNLVSPISGDVEAVNVTIGKFVSPNDVMFNIVNRDNMFLNLTLFEKDAGTVETGDSVRFYLNNETEYHEAVIARTGKALTPERTLPVYAQVLSNCPNVIPGMYVDARIELTRREVLSVPSEAVVDFDDHFYIFVFERNKEEDGQPFTEYRMIEVRRGAVGDGYTEIILPDGFDANSAKVVVKGAYNLLSAKKNAGEMAC
jgi:cobalt-zinc-cadmium efflux system membrane fusion protein